MKTLLLIPLLLISLHAAAAKEVIVEKGTTTTAPGIGGNAEIGYAFAKGDIVAIDAAASKQLQLLLAFVFPDNTVGRAKYTKHAKLTFTMPDDGIVIFRFISDRDGTNTINYTVTRMPASDTVQNYNTKVEWQKPADHAGAPIPKRVGGN
jgi:hypothetical protein